MNQMYQRYAIALFSLAKEENHIDEYLQEAKQIIEICNQNQELVIMLKDYGLSIEEKKQIIASIFEGKVYQDMFHFMCVIIDNHRGKYLKDILQEFCKVCYKHLNVKLGQIYSASPLTEIQVANIEQKISQMLNAKVQLENKIQPDLIGGFKIVVEEFLYDYSIQHKINQLKKELLQINGKEDHHEN